VQRFDIPLEVELAREVREETGLDISRQATQLLTSRINEIKMIRYQKYLRVKYPVRRQFLWNTYLVNGIKPKIKLVPGDDCQKLIWVPLNKIKNYPNVSSGISEILNGLSNEA